MKKGHALRWALRALPAATATFLLLGIALLSFIRVDRTIEGSGEVRVERYQLVRAGGAGDLTESLVENGDQVRRGEIVLRLRDAETHQARLAAQDELAQVEAQRRKLQRQLLLLTIQVQPREAAKGRFERQKGALSQAASATRLAEQRIDLETAAARRERSQRLAQAGLLSEQQLEEAQLAERIAAVQLRRSEIEDRLERNQAETLRVDLDLRAAEQRLNREALQTDLDALEHQVHRLHSQVEQLAGQEAALVVRATLDGIVVGEPRRELVGRRVQPGEKLFSIIDASSIDFLAHVPEAGILRVREGQPVRVEISGLPRQRFDTFTGAVKKVSRQPVEGTAVSYPIEIRLESPWVDLEEGRLFLLEGMRGSARIAYRRNVPLLAVLFEFLAPRSRAAAPPLQRAESFTTLRGGRGR